MGRGIVTGCSLLVLLAGCAGDDTSAPATDNDEAVEESTSSTPDEVSEAQESEAGGGEVSDPTGEDGGGTSGSEGSYGPCDETETEITLDEAPEALGFSADELLEAVGGEHELSILWHVLDAGPEFEAGEGTLTLKVEPNADTARLFACDDLDYPGEVAPRLEVDVTVELASDDGLLDERIETALAAEDVDLARLANHDGGHTLEVAPEDLSGALGAAVADYYASGSRRDLAIDFLLRPEGPAGAVRGPYSPHRTAPCRSTDYATFPADRPGGCPFDSEAADLGDDTLDGTLQKVNRTIVLAFEDGTEAEGELEVALQGPSACELGDELLTRVDVRLRSEAAGLDFQGPGSLWTYTDDDGVEHIDLDAQAAFDAETLAEDMSYEGDAPAAIVTLYASVNPNIVPATELTGGFRVREIERDGFATALPEVELGGGDIERCFDSNPVLRQPVLSAVLALPE